MLVPARNRSVGLCSEAPGARSPETKATGTVSVPVAALLPGDSPRSQGLDQEHATQLADYEGPLPPILVNRSDFRVIDGMHRLLAAHIRSQETIAVEFFDGSPEDAFLLAVEANVTHGLPLSLADRRAAASRIIASHPQMSDRAIARTSGLGSKAVAAIRRRSTDAEAQLNIRVGRDGRVRPLNSAEGGGRPPR
ncbi:ParB/RepB/Spo0J family partition protein [Streptomyces sp. NPDC002671]